MDKSEFNYIDDLERSEQEYFFGSQVLGAKLPDGTNTYIGQAINVLDSAGPYPEEAKVQLFKDEAYEGKTLIKLSGVNKAKTFSMVSEKFTEVFKSMDMSTKVETGAACFFTGSIEAKFGSSDKLVETAKFYNAVASVETNKHMLSADYAFGEDMRDIINPTVLKRIDSDSITPEIIFSKYGTHIITESSLGGCIQVTGIYNSSESIKTTDFQVAIDAACAYVSASADVKLTESQKTIIGSTIVRAQSYGGNVAVVAGIHNLSEIAQSFKAWADSVRTKEEQVLSKIYAYMPIWELAESPVRQEQLRKAFYRMAGENFNYISNYFKITPLPTKPYPVALSSKILTIYKNIQPVYMRLFFEGAREKGFAGVDAPNVSALTTFNYCENYDGTVSFKSQMNDRFLTVHYASTSYDDKFRDISQLYCNSESIGDRQKFIIEKNGDSYKLKSVYSNKYVRAIYKKMAANGSGGMIYVADASENDALLFSFYKI